MSGTARTGPEGRRRVEIGTYIHFYEKFLENYAEKSIAGWKGLKVKHLPVLLPVDISTMDAAEEVEYSMEDAIELLKNSTIFDQFVTDTMNDFEQFSVKKAETNIKN